MILIYSVLFQLNIKFYCYVPLCCVIIKNKISSASFNTFPILLKFLSYYSTLLYI